MSPKPTSPLLGYNNNVRHKGKVFHVQTEDSGVKYGHIITQLFMDGGRILKSVKTSYAEYVANERRGEIVREMMKQQHKAMFIALRDGRFDAAIEGAASGALTAAALPPVTSPSRATQPESTTMPAVRPAVDAAIAEAAAAGAEAVVRYAASEMPVPPRLARGSGPVMPATPTIKMASVQAEPGAPAAPSPSLGRSARPMSAPAREPTPQAPMASRSTSREPPPPAAAASRYAMTRPASIFGQSRPLRGRSVFGDELVSDKSLDEVILSYLAAELENEKK